MANQQPKGVAVEVEAIPAAITTGRAAILVGPRADTKEVLPTMGMVEVVTLIGMGKAAMVALIVPMEVVIWGVAVCGVVEEVDTKDVLIRLPRPSS